MQVFPSFDWCQLGREVASGVFALAGLWIAGQGLKTWRRQMKGTHDYEAARQIHRATLKLRDAIQFSRRVPFPAGMGALTSSPNGTTSGSNEFSKATASYYEHACAPVWSARTDLQAALFEAEVLVWGAEFREVADELFVLITEWNLDVSMYIASLSPDLTETEDQGIQDWRGGKRKVVGLSWHDKPDADDFDSDLQLAVSQIQRRLAKHIKA